jgi:hypothetical protein
VEGWFVQTTNRSPTSASGLHLLIAALRSFYAVMARGVFDPQDQHHHPLYAFDHPMYSKVLVAWRSEHRKWIRNAGAPDRAGIRSESRADSARQPVGFFQVRVQPFEPPVARDSESTRLAILAANAGRVVTREEIFDMLWGVDYVAESNIVDREIRNRNQGNGCGPRLHYAANLGNRCVPDGSDGCRSHVLWSGAAFQKRRTCARDSKGCDPYDLLRNEPELVNCCETCVHVR